MSDSQTIDDKVNVLLDPCAALSAGQPTKAGAIIESRYPFVPIEKVKRRYSTRQALQVFIRDGFVDRFLGGRLICPGALRLVSRRLPVQFPYHPNWRGDACHFAFWELSPTVDHIVP